MRTQEAGAGHDLRPYQGRGDQRREPLGQREVEGHVHQPELEPGADAGQIVEPATGDLHTSREVDRAEQLAEVGVVPWVEVEGAGGADLADERPIILATGGHPIQRDVAECADDPHELGVGLGGCGLRGFHLRREVLGLRDESRLLLFGGGRDLLSEGVLLRPERLEIGDRRPARRIRSNRLFHQFDRSAACSLRAPDQVRILAQQSRVDHPASLAAAPKCRSVGA